MEDNIIDKTSQNEINFLKTQAEKSLYLGEYKENVALALTEEQINSGVVYEEVLLEMKKPTTASLKLKREIDLKKLRPYIKEAEAIGLRYTLIDELSLSGDIALVVVAKEPFDNDDREIVVEDIETKFKKSGLDPKYIKAFGKKLCEKHYEEVEEKLPEYAKKYEKISFIDRLLGDSCPVCQYEREKNR